MAELTVPVTGNVKEQRQEVKLSIALYLACGLRRQQISIKNKNISSKTGCHLLSNQRLLPGWLSGTKAHSRVLARFFVPLVRWPAMFLGFSHYHLYQSSLILWMAKLQSNRCRSKSQVPARISRRCLLECPGSCDPQQRIRPVYMVRSMDSL